MLLFIRRGDRINLLRYIQASLDPDVDVKKADYSQPGQSPEDLDALSANDMAQAQLAARKLALERIGESVEILDGMQVTSVVAGRPASEVLAPGDVILAVDGRAVGPGDEDNVISTVIGALQPGETVSLRYERDGATNTVEIDTADNGSGRAIIGVLTEPNVQYPFDIDFEGRIESIGGPSAGLAMTLALLDELTPGELTGGTNVAVTGAIDIDGGVHEVGRVDLKAKAAKRRDATLMLVPECSEPEARDAYETEAHYRAAVDFYESCEAEVRRARDAIDTVIEVATLDEALAALAAHGGDELPPVPTTTSVPTTTTLPA
jgi:PDZ domain-containing protein